MLDIIFSSIECMIDNAEVREPFSSSDYNIVTFDLLCDSQITTWKGYFSDYRRGNYKKWTKVCKVWFGMHYCLIMILTKRGLSSRKCWMIRYPSLFQGGRETNCRIDNVNNIRKEIRKGY